MSVARFIADQRTKFRVPHAVTCRVLQVSPAWFSKRAGRAEESDGPHTDTDRRRAELAPEVGVRGACDAAVGRKRDIW